MSTVSVRDSKHITFPWEEKVMKREVSVGDYQGLILIPRAIAEAVSVISDLIWVE